MCDLMFHLCESCNDLHGGDGSVCDMYLPLTLTMDLRQALPLDLLPRCWLPSVGADKRGLAYPNPPVGGASCQRTGVRDRNGEDERRTHADGVRCRRSRSCTDTRIIT